MTIHSLDEAIRHFLATLERRPECDGLAATAAAMRGEPRRYPALRLEQGGADEKSGEPTVSIADSRERGVAEELLALLEPLDLLNPVTAALPVARGSGTLLTCFGVALDPASGKAVSAAGTMAGYLAAPAPDPAESGVLPELRARIAFLRQALPPDIKIALPSLQGPFNILQGLIGDDAYLAPLGEPDEYAALMGRIVDLWIAVRRNLVAWIGPEHALPLNDYARIAECSATVVSPRMYDEHILPYDRRLGEACGRVHIHPCGSPHIFRATVQNLPVGMTEAGRLLAAAAGAIGVDEAVEAIGTRPILLHICEDLAAGEEEATIRRHLDLYRERRRLLFSYTCAHWGPSDRERMRALHGRLNAYWDERTADE